MSQFRERWKNIEGWPGYEVSDLGRVLSRRRHHPRILKPDERRYALVVLQCDCKIWHVHVHTLVLNAFVGPCPDGMQCAHGDNNKLNNRLDNLRWDTPVGNNADKIVHGTHQIGSYNPFAKLNENQVVKIRILKAKGERSATLADMFGVKLITIQKIVSRERWKHV